MTDIYDLEPSDTWKAEPCVKVKGADLGFSITRPERVPLTTAQLVDRIDALNNLVVVARLLCDNVETVGTHHRIDGKYLEELRKALDGL